MPDTERNERRREKRTPAARVLDFRTDIGACRASKCFGLMRDLSKSGFSMYTRHELQPGDTLEISIERSKPRKATVRWCRKMAGEFLHMTGLSFN